MADGLDDVDADKAQRFRDAALSNLDSLYTFARYLLRSADDAEDAVQECYLRAFRYYDRFRGDAIKPWLMAILRNVCRAEFARRASNPLTTPETAATDSILPLWQERQDSPETAMSLRHDIETIRALLTALPDQHREVIMLRELEGLSYREIAEVMDVPVGTVMSRIARARSTLREAWINAEHGDKREQHRATSAASLAAACTSPGKDA
jgi:RNA polymerase sigma-70 factor, ECF subfamily